MAQIPLRPPRAPSIPLAPVDYKQGYIDQFTSALRLYFNQIDNGMGSLLSDTGGSSLSLPHIAALDTTVQYATANNTPTKVLWNTLGSSSGFKLDPTGYVEATYSGVYKFDYRLQFANTADAAHTVNVWLKVNNANVVGTASKFDLLARKTLSVPSYLVAYSSFTLNVNAGDKIELWWATDLAYIVSPATAGVYMQYEAAQTTPYARSSVPSAVGSITFVSRLPTDPAA